MPDSYRPLSHAHPLYQPDVAAIEIHALVRTLCEFIEVGSPQTAADRERWHYAIKTIAHMTSLHANELFKWVCGQAVPKAGE